MSSNTGINYSLSAQFTSSSVQYLSKSSETILQAGNRDFTISAWVYLDTKAASMAIVAKSTNDSIREFYLQYVQGTDRFRFILYDGTNVISGIVSDNTFGSPPTGQWIFVVATHTSGQVGIYVNGGLGSTASTTGTPGITSGQFSIGAVHLTPVYPWNGRIQGVGLWKRVLSSDERSYLYNGGSGRSYPFIL